MRATSTPHDVLAVGEALVELSAPGSLREARELRLSFSGDALNAAANAAAGGARTALLTRAGDDELGDALLDRARALGIDTTLVRRDPAPNGTYLTGADPEGAREFVYLRTGSAASRLAPEDLDAETVRAARVLWTSGVTCAISPSAAAAAVRAAELVHAAGGLVVYDPNHRRRLASPADARRAFASIAPLCALVTPSWPSDARALFDAADPLDAAQAALRAGARAVAVTLGADGVLFDDGSGPRHLPAVPAPAAVDATGCGDALTGMTCARLALGDDLASALALGMSAAALALGGQGGTGRVATLAQARRHLQLSTDVHPQGAGR